MLKPVLGSQLNLGSHLTRGLKGLWLMNEGSGNKVFDLSGNGNHGTITGALWVPGKFGYALAFDPDNDYVDCGGSPWNTFNDVTISVWVNSKDTSPPQYVFNYFVDGFNGWGIRIKSGVVGIFDDIDNAGVELYATSISSNVWYNFVAVLDSLENKLYINGNLVGSGTTSSDDWSSYNGNLVIGDRGVAAGIATNGLIDHATVWNRALSASERALLYQAMFQI